GGPERRGCESERLKEAADHGPDRETHAERGADEPHAPGPLLGSRPVRDVGLGHAQVSGPDSSEDSRGEQEDDRRRGDGQDEVSRRRQDETPKDHGPSTNAVAQPTEDGREAELHEEEDRHKSTEDCRPILATHDLRVERQEWDDHAEPDQIDEDREQGDEKRGALQADDLVAGAEPVRRIKGWARRFQGSRSTVAYRPCSSRQLSVTTNPFAVFFTRIEFAVSFVTSRPASRIVSFARTRISRPPPFAMSVGTVVVTEKSAGGRSNRFAT